MMGKSLRKTGTERERQGKWHREVCFWIVLTRGFPPEGVSSRAPEAHGRTLGKLLLAWCSVILTLVQERCPFVVARNVTCQCEMLWAGVEGSCLHRPENWLVRQLIETRPVHKVGFIREKGKATARAVHWKLETGGSLLR
jgi:hypothetical protein